jgi:heat shock protein HtpX
MGGTEAPAAGPSLAGRFAAAIALTVGFYLLALALAAGLLAAAILPWVLSGHGNLWVTLTGLVLGVTILVAIVPRRRRFEAPGARVTAEDQPRLIELIAEESRALDMAPPDEVYATFEVNAAVTEAGRRGRVMIVGLPLLQFVSERGLRGTVAHELGHYAGGDTRLGPWIYRTRETIGRTLHHLTDDDGDEGWTQLAVRKPFEWYAAAFLRITATISRRQEYAADRFAVHRAGREVYVDTLRRLHAYAPAFDPYWSQEVVPALTAERRPPVAAGFATFIGTETVQRAGADWVDEELREGKTERYDSHPALADRLRALEELPPGKPDDSPPAAEVLRDLPALEQRVFGVLYGDEAAGSLEPIAWEDVGRSVYLERARELTSRFHYVLAGVSAVGLGEAVGRSSQLAGEVQRREPDIGYEDAAALVPAVLRDGLLLALDDAGWEVTANLAEPVLCRHAGQEVVPSVVVAELYDKTLDADAWAARTRELGVADLSLERPAAVAAAR